MKSLCLSKILELLLRMAVYLSVLKKLNGYTLRDKKKKDYHNNYEIVVKALSSTWITNNSEAGD